MRRLYIHNFFEFLLLGAAFPTACGRGRQVRSYALVVTVVLFVRPERVGVDPASWCPLGILVLASFLNVRRHAGVGIIHGGGCFGFVGAAYGTMTWWYRLMPQMRTIAMMLPPVDVWSGICQNMPQGLAERITSWRASHEYERVGELFEVSLCESAVGVCLEVKSNKLRLVRSGACQWTLEGGVSAILVDAAYNIVSDPCLLFFVGPRCCLQMWRVGIIYAKATLVPVRFVLTGKSHETKCGQRLVA